MIRFFIHRPALVHAITIAVVLIGLVVILRTQREAFPAVTINQVVITAILPGASPDDVEAKLTIPIEEAIREVDGIEEYSSISREGLSAITVELFEDLGPEQVTQVERDIQKALDAISDLPPELESPPVLTRFNPGRTIVMEVALTGPSERLVGAAEQLRPRLEAIPGIGVVHQVGIGDPEIEVLLDPVRARAQQVTLDEVMAALQRRNVASTGGRLIAWPEQKQVVLSGEYRDVEAIAATILRFRGPAGGALTIGDVAQVRMTTEELGLRSRADGQPSIALLIRKRETADILDTVDAVEALLAETELPEGVEARIHNDLSQQTRNRLGVVISNGIGGVILVLAVLLLFLTGRIAFWVAFGMPFALIGTAALMPLLGITINMISLAGFVLVIGIVVDDAIVVSERVAYYLEQGVDVEEATLKGAREMALPVLGSSLTTILAFTPLFLLGGLPGKFSWAIPVIVILTLSVSLFECFFILPSHIVGHRHAGPGGSKDDPDTKPEPTRGKAGWIVWLERVYAAALRRLLPLAPLVVLSFAGLFGYTLHYLFTSVPVVLFPQDDSDAIYLKVAAPLGTPIERTEAIVRGLEQQAKQIVGDDLKGMTARLGHQDYYMPERERGTAEHEAYVAIYLRDDRAHSAHAWIAQIEQHLHVPDDVEVIYDARRIGPPLGQPVQIHVSSRDDEIRRSGGAAVRAYLGSVHGVVDLQSDERPGMRQIDLRLDHRRMALEQVPATTVARAIQAAFFGLPVTELRQGQDPVTIRVRFDAAARGDLDLLLASSVRGDDGRLHALRKFVEPVEVDALAARHRRQGVRTTTFTARIDARSGETASSLATRMQAELAPAMRALRAEQDSDLEVTIAGEASKTGETLGEMPLVFGLALVGIVLVVMLLSGSLTQALFVISAVPLGLIGVVWAYAAHGIPISMFALLGVTGLAGVVVNDAIVMVDALSKTGLGSSESSLIDEVAAIAAERLRPVLLTTLTTVAGVMPTAYGLGGRDAVLSPMSLALGYGLIFATAITLLLIPSFYVIRRRMERRRDKRKARRRARRSAAAASLVLVAMLGGSACGSEPRGDDEVATSASSSESTDSGTSETGTESSTTDTSGSETETGDPDLTPTDVVSGLGCASELPDDSDARWQEFLAKREGWLHALAEPVRDCVERHDTEHPAFHGCIDWHSAVHGTWALHALYRMTGEPLYLDAADAVLDPASIAGELADIEANALPFVELLYGRSWFLLLARERELAGAGEDLRPLAELVADQLETTLAAQSPAQLATWMVADDYLSASWALLNLWRWSVHVGDTARVEWIETLVADVAMGVDCPLVDEVGFEDDFFPPCLHRAMLVLTVLPSDQTAAWLASELPGPGEFPLEPLCMPSPAHTAGLNFSRSWGLWSLWLASGDTFYRDLYVEHVFRHVEQPAYWAEDYYEHSHWIAQFGIHAIQLSWD